MIPYTKLTQGSSSFKYVELDEHKLCAGKLSIDPEKLSNIVLIQKNSDTVDKLILHIVDNGNGNPSYNPKEIMVFENILKPYCDMLVSIGMGNSDIEHSNLPGILNHIRSSYGTFAKCFIFINAHGNPDSSIVPVFKDFVEGNLMNPLAKDTSIIISSCYGGVYNFSTLNIDLGIINDEHNVRLVTVSDDTPTLIMEFHNKLKWQAFVKSNPDFNCIDVAKFLCECINFSTPTISGKENGNIIVAQTLENYINDHDINIECSNLLTDLVNIVADNKSYIEVSGNNIIDHS